MPVIDASVYVTLVTPDENAHERTRAWFEDALRSGVRLYAPAIILSEVAAAISRGQGNDVKARKAASRLKRSRAIELQAVSVSLADRAADISAVQRIRGCDALYVALAELLQDELVTLDRQQKERGAAVITTRSP